MKRIGIEIPVLGAGVVAAGSAVVSDEVFNAGIALLAGTILLAVAFLMGLTHTPFARETPRWRKVTTAAELICAVAAALFLFGVIQF